MIIPIPYRAGNCGSIVADCPQTPCPESKETEAFYGGHFVCESVGGEQREFLIRAANCHQALLNAIKIARSECSEHNREYHHRTSDDVLALFDDAIAEASK